MKKITTLANAFLFVLLSLVHVVAPGVQAATLTLNDFGTAITLSGEIVPGDAERIASHFAGVKGLKLSPKSTHYSFPNTLYLNSPGGDVAEAFRIAELVKTLALAVVVAPAVQKGLCASSCFLIYVAALDRNATGIDVIRAEGSKGNLGPLGIHRPYLREIGAGFSGAQQQEATMAAMRENLSKSGVGHALIDKMMSHASNDIYWLTTEDIRALGSYSPGVEEQLIARCGYNQREFSQINIRDYFTESTPLGRIRACVTNFMVDTYYPVRNAAVDRIRQSWRPWKK